TAVIKPTPELPPVTRQTCIIKPLLHPDLLSTLYNKNRQSQKVKLLARN
ncbi:MAG: hypothetical protein RLZZ86_2721, partial [Cyanobacteriota bacterium]